MTEIAGVLLCGGKGTRLSSLTEDKVPKSLFRVGGRELIGYSVSAMENSSSISRLVFSVGHLGEMVEEWVANNVHIPSVVSYQKEPGVIGAINSVTPAVDADRYAICNTDELRLNLDLERVIRLHYEMGKLATIVATESSDLYRHRLLDISSGRVTGSRLKPQEFIDNPKAKGIVNAGLLIVERRGLDLIDTAKHGNDWSALVNPLHDAHELAAYVDPSIVYHNVGTPEEYALAERAVSQDSKEHPRVAMSR